MFIHLTYRNVPHVRGTLLDKLTEVALRLLNHWQLSSSNQKTGLGLTLLESPSQHYFRYCS